MAPRKPLGPRVDALEEEVEQLKKVSRQLTRDQRATTRHLRELSDLVHSILPGVNEKLDEQTAAINKHVDDQLAEQRTFVLATVVDVARQWPAAAIVCATAALSIVAGVLVNWLLAAEQLPHIH